MINLQANKTMVEKEARDIASSINMVICGKVPSELTEKYLNVLLERCSYSVAVSRKAFNNTSDISNSYRLSVDGNITVVSVYKAFFVMKKALKDLRNIVKAYDSYESRQRLMEELKAIRRNVRSAYL